jgi:formate/nitrite transporter FocA (FNT family)
MINFSFLLKQSILAGVCIALGGTAYLTVGSVIGSILFSFGLIIVVHNKHILYTGTAGFVDKDDWYLIPISIIGNLIGCFIIGQIVKHVNPTIVDAANVIVNTRLQNGIINNFLLAILCGFIMTEAVFHSKFNGEKYLPLLFGVPLFILCGFTHSIADIFYYTVGSKDLIINNMSNVFYIWISTLAGNFIGCNISNKRKQI